MFDELENKGRWFEVEAWKEKFELDGFYYRSLRRYEQIV
jgi:hypothetical protein